MSLEVGDVVEGVVTGITDFGAFVKLPDGRTGLVHISEVADTYVKDIENYVNMDERLNVKILNFKDNGNKIGLSIRQAQEGDGGSGGGRRRGQNKQAFEKKLKRFMKNSEQRLRDVKTQTDGRRGGGGGAGF